jgi:hypothetical protein
LGVIIFESRSLAIALRHVLPSQLQSTDDEAL